MCIIHIYICNTCKAGPPRQVSWFITFYNLVNFRFMGVITIVNGVWVQQPATDRGPSLLTWGVSSPTISVGLDLEIPIGNLLAALTQYQCPGRWEVGWNLMRKCRGDVFSGWNFIGKIPGKMKRMIPSILKNPTCFDAVALPGKMVTSPAKTNRFWKEHPLPLSEESKAIFAISWGKHAAWLGLGGLGIAKPWFDMFCTLQIPVFIAANCIGL